MTEQVQKGNIAIIKHTDDGETKIETPEEGAVFAIYLKSSGSFDAAKDTERDYADKYVVCRKCFLLGKNVADDSIITTIEVPQNEKGIDTEDRVQTLKTQLALI